MSDAISRNGVILPPIEDGGPRDLETLHKLWNAASAIDQGLHVHGLIVSGIPTDLSSNIAGPPDASVLDACQTAPMDMKKIGRRVAMLLEASGLNQADAAAAIGIGRSTLGEIKNGTERGGLGAMVAIADYFKVPMDWLLCRKPPPGGPLVGHFVDDPDELAWLKFWQDMDDAERIGLLSVLRGRIRRIPE